MSGGFGWLRELTWRRGVLAAIFLYIAGYPLYSYVQSQGRGGIYRHGDRISVDLQAMSDFDMNQITGESNAIPKRFRDLDGRRVELVGEIWAPLTTDRKLGAFDLVYSIGKCCFNGPPKVQHFVKATVPNHQEVNYFEGLVSVTGVLHVGVRRSDGVLQSVYRIDVEEVKPAL